jgi:hypothetical protein
MLIWKFNGSRARVTLCRFACVLEVVVERVMWGRFTVGMFCMHVGGKAGCGEVMGVM